MARTYNQTARAEAVAERETAVLEAAFDAFLSNYYDDVTLRQIAAAAGTTEQTVLRYFGSKEGVFEAMADRLGHRLAGARAEVEPGDWRGAVRETVATYERYGRRNLLMLAQEDRIAPIKERCDRGRADHRETVMATFAQFLPPPRSGDHDAMAALFVVALDVYTWKLLRLDAGLARAETEAAMAQMVQGLIRQCAELGGSDEGEGP